MAEQPLQLGRGGPTISSPLGMGLWSWGDSMTWGYNGYDKDGITAASMQGAYDAALAGGCNLFDTAESYGGGLLGGWGASERFLGGCMRARQGQGGPAPVVISKYLPQLPWRLREPQSITAALQATVERLEVEAVDVYLVHTPAATFKSTRTLANALAHAVDSGLARAAGVSNYSAAQLAETHRLLAERGVPLAVNQVEFSLCHALPEHSGLLEACAELGVSVMAYSPLAMGRLTGKYSAANPPQGARRFGSYSFERIQPIVDKLAELGAAHGGKTPAQVALNWCICKGAVPIPGAKTAAQAEANCGALGWRLAADEVEALDALAIEGQLTFGQHG